MAQRNDVQTVEQEAQSRSRDEEVKSGAWTAIALLLVGLAVAGAVIATVTRNTAPPAMRATTIGEIRGDTLGMQFKDFTSKHPNVCRTQDDICVFQSTYAGMDAYQESDFFKGQLFRISYSIIGENQGSQLLSAVSQKYGAPKSVGNDTFRWNDGLKFIEVWNSSKHASVSFYMQDVRDQWSADYERKKAEKAAKDGKDQ